MECAVAHHLAHIEEFTDLRKMEIVAVREVGGIAHEVNTGEKEENRRMERVSEIQTRLTSQHANNDVVHTNDSHETGNAENSCKYTQNY